MKQHVPLLTDDNGVRMLAMVHGVPVIGSIGILIRARLDGVIPALKRTFRTPLEALDSILVIS